MFLYRFLSFDDFNISFVNVRKPGLKRGEREKRQRESYIKSNLPIEHVKIHS